MTRRQSRRRFIKTGALTLSTTTMLAGCSGGGNDSSDGGGTESDGDGTGSDGDDSTSDGGATEKNELADKLHFYSWGGSTGEALDKHLVKPFEEETGVTVKRSQFGSGEKMIANVRSSSPGTYDVIMPDTSGIYRVTKQDLVEPIRTENVPNWSNLLPVFGDLNVDPGSKPHGVAVYYGTTGMAYNRNQVDGEPPFSWDKAWQDKFKGKVILEDLADLRVFTTALHVGNQIVPLSLGADTDEVDGSYKSGIDKVYDEMAEQHKLVNKYWSSGNNMTKMFRNKEAYIGEAWAGRIAALQDEGYEFMRYTVPKEGASTWGDALAIAKGSKRRHTAEKFINFALTDEVMKNLSPALGYPPSTKTQTSEIKDMPDFDPSGGERLKFRDPQFNSAHMQDWTNTYQKIKLGQYNG